MIFFPVACDWVLWTAKASAVDPHGAVEDGKFVYKMVYSEKKKKIGVWGFTYSGTYLPYSLGLFPTCYFPSLIFIFF